MNKCYAYARVSTDNESQDTSYEGQINYFKTYCDNNGYELVNVYSDRESGTSVYKRDGLLNMLSNCGVVLDITGKHFTRLNCTSPINSIILKNTSRLGRNILDVINICSLLKQNNVTVIFIENNINTADTGSDFMLTLLQVFDQQYSKDLSSKVRQGYKIQAKTTNNIHSNSRIYGYEYKDRKLTIIEEEAEVIRTIYDLYLDGYGIRRIQNYLRDNNILTRQGKEFGKTTILNILSNEKYYGCNNRLKYEATGVFADTKTVKLRNIEDRQYKQTDDIEPIISKDEFDKVQSILDSRRGNRRGIHRCDSMYANKIICAKCNSPYTHNTDRGRGYYNCSLKKKKGVEFCNNRNISESKLNTLIDSDYLIQELKSIKLLKSTKIYRSIKELEKVLNSNHSDELSILEAEMIENTKQQEQLLDLYLDNLINKDIYSKRLNTLQEKYEALQQGISRYKATSEQLKERIDSRKQLIQAINQIEIKDTYTIEEILNYISKIVINDSIVTPYIVIEGEEFEGSMLEM